MYIKSPGIAAIKWRYKPLLHLLLIMPAVYLVTFLFLGKLGANPVEVITHETGEWGLRILLLSLAVSPAARILGAGWFIQFRRLIGLYSFFYILMHFSIYLLLDLSLDFGYLIEDILDRKYITVGFASFVILILLAITSPINIRRRMGQAWSRLHQLVYAAGILGILHFLWSTKADDTEPFIYVSILLILIGYRVVRYLKKRVNTASAQTQARPTRDFAKNFAAKPESY